MPGVQARQPSLNGNKLTPPPSTTINWSELEFMIYDDDDEASFHPQRHLTNEQQVNKFTSLLNFVIVLLLSKMYSLLLTDVFINWAIGVPVLYFILNVLLRWANRLPKTLKGSNGSDIMAYELTSCFVCFYVATAGTMGWFNLCSDCDFESIENDRNFGRSVYFEQHLAAPMLSYQFWNFVFCLALPEMREGVMLLHHIASGLCALFSVHPFLQYYGLFYFGIPEITSVPLTYVSMSKSFPFLKTDYPYIYEMSKWSFGVLFLLIRLVMWTYVTVFYWIDSVDLVRNGTPHSMFVVGYYWFANVVLTGMQYFWGYKIISQMSNGGHEVVRKKKSSDRKKKKA